MIMHLIFNLSGVFFSFGYFLLFVATGAFLGVHCRDLTRVGCGIGKAEHGNFMDDDRQHVNRGIRGIQWVREKQKGTEAWSGREIGDTMKGNERQLQHAVMFQTKAIHGLAWAGPPQGHSRPKTSCNSSKALKSEPTVQTIPLGPKIIKIHPLH